MCCSRAYVARADNTYLLSHLHFSWGSKKAELEELAEPPKNRHCLSPVPSSGLVTGFALGLVEGLTKTLYPEASSTVIFVIMAIVLLIKPAGLFGKAG